MFCATKRKIHSIILLDLLSLTAYHFRQLLKTCFVTCFPAHFLQCHDELSWAFTMIWKSSSVKAIVWWVKWFVVASLLLVRDLFLGPIESMFLHWPILLRFANFSDENRKSIHWITVIAINKLSFGGESFSVTSFDFRLSAYQPAICV